MNEAGWAIYRVRRCYSANAQAWRAVEPVARGDRADTGHTLGSLATHLRIRPRHEGEHTRVWLTGSSTTFPRLEEFFVAAPAGVLDKKRPGFDARWHAHLTDELRSRETAALEFFAVPTDLALAA